MRRTRRLIRGLVAAFVLWRFGGKEITPVWSSKRAFPSALIGVGIGLAMVLPIAALLSLISGRVASDAFALLIEEDKHAGARPGKLHRRREHCTHDLVAVECG